jgi:hypothetical protein
VKKKPLSAPGADNGFFCFFNFCIKPLSTPDLVADVYDADDKADNKYQIVENGDQFHWYHSKKLI